MSLTEAGRAPVDLPADDALATALGAAFRQPVRLLARSPHPYASTFPGEVVRCESGGRQLTVLCKYEAGRRHPCFGHRRGPGYEAVVYEAVVSRLPLPAVGFHGSWTTASGDTWLFLEHLGDGGRLDETPDARRPLTVAARWAGRFHRLTTGMAGVEGVLAVYSGDYYAGWAQRTAQFARDRRDGPAWLPEVCARAEPLLRDMAELPSCVVHGEFTPQNLLVRGDEVLPVDWETAAVAVGVVDLAALVDGWPEELAGRCEAAYVHARWPDRPPDDHARTLDLARLYWQLRWLGDRPEWLAQRGMQRRFAAVHRTSRRLGLV